MKKLKLLLALFALLVGTTASWAQQVDVTSTYLTNADFSVGTPIDNGICTYGKDMAGNSTTYYGAQEVSGWTNASVGETDSGYDNSKLAGGIFAYGGTPFLGGSGFTAPANAPEGSTGNTLGLLAVWGGSVQYTQDVTLPAGSYTLRFKTYNATNADFGSGKFITTNLFGFVSNNGTTYYAPSKTFAIGQWSTIAVTFNLTEETVGKISVGFVGGGGGGNMPHLFVDNVKILKNTYYEDVTSKVGVAQASWTGASDGLQGTAFKTSDGRDARMAAFYGSTAVGEKISQTVTGLKKGTYEAVVYAYSMNEWGNWAATLNHDAGDVGYVMADGKYQIKEWINARQGTHNANDYGIYSLSGIEVDDDGELKLAYVIDKENQTEWMAIQIQSLIYTKNLDLSGFVSAYQNALAAAKVTAAKADKMATSLKTALNTAIDTYDEGKVDLEDADAMEAATDALKTATAKAETSIASYAIITAGSIPNNSILGWTNTGTGSLEVNTWSTESGPVGNDTRVSYDGTGMTVPFIQSWVWKGSNNDVFLGNGTVSYTLAGLEPGEVYYAQALVRAYSEGGNVPNGPDFFINNVVTDMTTNGTAFDFAGMKGFYGTLGGVATVGGDGKIVLGVTIQDANYNWVAFKNVSIQSMDDAFNAAVAKVTALEGTVPSSVYNTAYTVVTGYSDANKPTTAAEYETAIAAIEAAATTASAYVEPYAAWTAAKNKAENNYSSSAFVTTIKDAQITNVETADEVSDVTNATTELNNAISYYDSWGTLKASAEALVTVDNDNPTATSTLATAISEQNTAAEAATTATAFGNAVSTLKDAMVTYVGETNPVGDGNKFNLTFMLTNPDVSGFANETKNVPGWYSDYNGNIWHQAQVNRNARSSDNTKDATYEFWSSSAISTGDFTVYQKVESLPEGTYEMSCYAFADANGVDGATNNQVYFYANDTQGSKIVSPEKTLIEASISFVNASEQDVKIGLRALESNQYRWMGMGYVELYKVPAVTITIDQGVDYTPESVAGKVTLKRTLSTTKWNTFVVPFQITNSELKTAFGKDVEVAEWSEVPNVEVSGSSTIEFNLMDIPAITPNKPVLLKPSETNVDDTYEFEDRTISTSDPVISGKNYDFVGSYEALITLKDGDYFIANNKLWEAEDGVTTVRGTRAYLRANSAEARIVDFRIGESETTGIVSIANEVKSADNATFDLQGRKVANVKKGLYIKNSKKVVVR